jgi:hypothetical protein
MRLPTSDLCAGDGTDGADSTPTNSVEDHIRVLAERLWEAYEVVMEHNKIGREKQKIQYKNNKLVTFAEGEYVYLKEMSVGVGKTKTFRDRWRGPFLITNRLSDWNYQIQLQPGKRVVVNINCMKRCHNPPTKKTRSNRDTAGSKCKPTDNDQNSETEMTDIVIRSQQIPCLERVSG